MESPRSAHVCGAACGARVLKLSVVPRSSAVDVKISV